MKGILCKFVHFVASTPFNTYFVTTAYKATVPATNAYTIFNTPAFFDNDYHFYIHFIIKENHYQYYFLKKEAP